MSTAENLAPYNKAALRKFLEVFPEIDAVQFRMHPESGLERDEMKGFWHEIFGMIKQMRPGIRVDLRAKELPDDVIEDGLKPRTPPSPWRGSAVPTLLTCPSAGMPPVRWFD